jgi:2-polyprenyl-3-methyl-5-hydroxy-6-metoxy-1,4-benzoquinol methylase
MVGLLQPARVCDIGPGEGKYGRLVKQRAIEDGFPSHVTAIEIDPSYVETYRLRSTYDDVIVADAVDLIDTPRIRFDLVIIGDCIEHTRKSAVIDLLNFLVYRTGHICIVFPEATVQDDRDEHTAEAHISTWSEEDFRGWNTLHKCIDHAWAKMRLFMIKGYQDSRMIITS